MFRQSLKVLCVEDSKTTQLDENDSFNTQILSNIFRNSQIFNGKGVFVSRKHSMGIYYNTKGNTVLYINKL